MTAPVPATPAIPDQRAVDPQLNPEDGQHLVLVLSEFARTLLTDFPIQGILDHLVKRIAGMLPVDAAGVTLIADADATPQYLAASDSSALQYEKLQTELNEGPCLLSVHIGQAVAVPDLQTEQRFPAFAPRAMDAGLRAVFAFPLRHLQTRLGALDLYRRTGGPLSESEMTAAQTLADVATAYLLNAKSRQALQTSSDRSLHASLHDRLTGLPNRALLLERIEHALTRRRGPGSTSCLLFLDLNDFKAVNDTHGHRAGDELLTAVGRRLSHLLRLSDTVARLAGDEFVIFCDDLGDAREAQLIADRVRGAFVQPFQLADVTLQVSASIGVAIADVTDLLPEQLLHRADLAMYQAKKDSKRAPG